MRIAVIIVNYSTAELTAQAVESVLSQPCHGYDIDIHVLDNASPHDDGDYLAELARTKWPDRVHFWQEAENHGFGRGNNLILAHLADQRDWPHYVFLLNPDAKLENDVIGILVDELKHHPEAAGVGAGVKLPDGTSVSAAFPFPSAMREIAFTINFGPIGRLLGNPLRVLPPDHPAGEVDWVVGAAVLFRFDRLAALGFFDPGYFLYYEESDLMYRIHQNQWTIRYQPEAQVSHEEGAATGVASSDTLFPRRPVYLYQSWRRFFTMRYGRVGALATALGVFAAAALGAVIGRIIGRRPALPDQFRKDHWKHVVLPLAGLRRDTIYDTDSARRSSARLGGFTNTNPSDLTFWQLVREDFRAHGSAPMSQGFWALFWHRFGNWRMSVRSMVVRKLLTAFYLLMLRMTQWTCGIDLPFSVIVGRRVTLEHFGGMILIATRIGDDVTIRHNTTFGISANNRTGRPTIGDRVEIGAGAVILGDLHIGDDAVIGANAVVRIDVPAGAVAGGVPARILRTAKSAS